MAMEGKMNACEGRVGEFLEKMTKSHAGGIEIIACKVGEMKLKWKNAQVWKEILEYQVEIQKQIIDSHKGFQSFTAQALNPIV